MDLGIKGKTALVAASSAGLGLACATALAREGCVVTINGRDARRLADARAGIEAATGARVHTVIADITTEAGRKAFVDACPEADILVNNTSAMVKSPRPHMALSTAARTGLTAFAKAMALESAIDNVTINNLLPERIDTGRQRFMAERMMKDKGIDMAEARRQIVQTVAAKRFGTPGEFGDACAYLCSAQAGFISGQNLQLDGGSYPGLI